MRCAATGTAVLLLAAIAVLRGVKADPVTPVAGQTVHFPEGTWSALPQAGPDGKVRQCVLVAPRSRAGGSGPIDSQLSLNISRGSGFTFALTDGKISTDDILDDEAEVILGDRSFPAVAFTISGARGLALHPGDAAGVLAALTKTSALRLRSAGDGLDTGPIALDLPAEALAWLAQCGKTFAIALDRPSDPDAPELPVPHPPSPEIGPNEPTAAGPAGIEIQQKISGWDASELRGADGRVLVCLIRQHYTAGGRDGRLLGTFLIVSRAKGLTMMLKDSDLDLPGNQAVDGTLTIENKSFTGFESHALGKDEIGIFPQHGMALAAALNDGATAAFKSSVEGFEFPIPSGVVPWLRACGHRWNIPFEPVKQ